MTSSYETSQGATPVTPLMQIAGVGNEFRRDDAVGLRVASILAEQPLSGVLVTVWLGDAATLAAQWSEDLSVVVVDATRSGAPPGSVARIDLRSETLPPQVVGESGHAWGVTHAVRLARLLKRLPRRLVLYGIEGQEFGHGIGLTEAVAAALPAVAQRIRDEVLAWRTQSAEPDV